MLFNIGACDTSMDIGGLRSEHLFSEDHGVEFVRTDDIYCANKTGDEARIEFLKGTNLEADNGNKLSTTDDTGPVGTSGEGKNILTEVGVQSRGNMFGFVEQCSANKTGSGMEMKSKKSLESDSYVETGIAIIPDAERLEIENLQEFESVEQSKICCHIEVGNESEPRQMTCKNFQEAEVSKEPEGRVIESNEMQVGEAKVSTLQKQFLKLSCEELASAVETSQPEKATNVQSLEMYDETQVSLNEQLQR